MLVLSRKKNERIVINNDTVVTVLEMRSDRVRIGIEAPKTVPVHRQEVFETIYSGPILPPASIDFEQAVRRARIGKPTEEQMKRMVDDIMKDLFP